LLDYEHVSQPIVLFKCDWVTNGVDRWGNPTYKHDEDGFLLVIFCHLTPKANEPYVIQA